MIYADGRLRAAAVPLHAAVGRVDARVPADDRREPRPRRRARHPRAVHRSLIIFFIARFVARLIGFWFSAIEQRPADAALDLPGDGAADAPAVDRAAVGLCDRRGVSLPARQPDRRVQRRQRVPRPDGDVRIERPREPDHERLHDHLLARAAGRRLRARSATSEGTVTHLGVLSTKVRTLRQEEVTIPNAVVVAQTTTDYSRLGETEGVFTPTSVTIGYDTPWRQVHALLLLAAERTAGPARRAEAGRASGGARGLLREVHAVGLPGAAAVAA